MNKTLALSMAAMVLAAAGAGDPLFAQGVPQTVTKADIVQVASGFRTSRIRGATVTNDHGDTIGTVDDIVISNGATNAYAILSVGGFLGVGSYLVAVPFKSLDIAKNKVTLAGATKDQLQSLPQFRYAKE
jgi:hypothetical protein